MIKKTRLATDEEKTLLIHYIVQNQVEDGWGNYQNHQQEHWQSASFVVIEVGGLEGKIIVVNQINQAEDNFLDIVTAHYLLHQDNTVSDLFLPEM